jgi:outer membrane protein
MKYLLFVLILSINHIQAQESWSLERCVRYALDHNLTIEQTNLTVEQAKIGLDQSKQARNPNLNGNLSAFWNFGRTIDPTTNEFITARFFSNNYGLNTNVILWNASRINNTVKQSKIDLEANMQDLEQAKRNIALVVASNFLNVLFAKENISISERQLLLTEQQLDQLNKLINAGARPQSEKLNMEVQIAQSEQALITSNNNLEIAYLNLKQSLQLDPSYEMDIEVPDDIETDTNPEIITFSEAFELARKNRPDLLAIELRQQSAEVGVDIAKSAYYPTLSLGGNVGSAYSNQARTVTGFQTQTFDQTVNLSSANPMFPFQDLPVTISTENEIPILDRQAYGSQLDQNLSYGFGFALNVPIYNRGAVNSNVKFAQLNAENNRISHDLALNNLKTTVQQSIADARAAKKQFEASNKTVEAQKLAFENTTKRLEIGETNSFEWETQKTNLENAELNALIDKYNYLFTIKTLEFYLGKPLKL